MVEVSRRYLELDDPFGPIPDLESCSDGRDVVVLTILAEKEEALENYGGLLDAGGYVVVDEGYEQNLLLS